MLLRGIRHARDDHAAVTVSGQDDVRQVLVDGRLHDVPGVHVEVDHPQSQQVQATLEAMASLQPGSELVFNYSSPHAALDHDDRKMVTDLERTVRRRSAPMNAAFVPDATATRVSEPGFDIRAHLGSRDLDERYLAGWEGLSTIHFGHLLHLRVRG